MTEPIRSHPHTIDRGDDSMRDQTAEVKTIGKTTVIIRSGLNGMTAEERRQWFEEEQRKGNPILQQISKAIFDCQR